MRRLDQDEREWIGALAIMTLIMGLSLSIVIDLTEEPLDNWGKEIMAKEKPDFIQSVIWLMAYVGKVVWVVFIIQPLFTLMRKFGYCEDMMPKRWIKYLGTNKRRMD